MFNPILLPVIFILFSLYEINKPIQSTLKLPKNWVIKTQKKKPVSEGLEVLPYIMIFSTKIDLSKPSYTYIYSK